MALLNQACLPGNITRFEIYSNYDSSVSIDVSGGVSTLSYYESILENTIKVTAIIADTGYAINSKDGKKATVGVIEGLRLSGGEKVLLDFEDNFGVKFKLVMYIGRIRNVLESTSNMVFTIDLVSKEFIMNELEPLRVSRRFDGNISTSVYNILTKDLKTEKTIDVDPTTNSYSDFGKYRKPLFLCTHLAKCSVPDIGGAKGKTAGYFFFETYDGFKFKSIDGLLSENRSYKSFLYNNTTDMPAGYNGKILNYTTQINIDVQQKFMMGAYGTKVKTFNPVTDEYNENGGLTASGEGSGVNLAGYEYPNLPEEFQGYTRVAYKKKSIGNKFASGASVKNQLEKSREENLEIDDVIAQATMRYNQLFTIKLTVTICGDLTLRAGDIIFCDFPELSSKSDQEYSRKTSGIYMISDLCHYFTPQQTFTKLDLVRDSYGRKPNKVRL
jgi:hypothetical protein